MSIVSVRARAGRWCDTSAVVRRPVAAALRAAGILGVVRYAPLPGLDAAHDIDGLELELLCEAGLQVALVQHVRFPGWRPADHAGGADALAASRHCARIGYPLGAVVYLDLEGISGTADETARFANDWCDAARQAGQQPGIYCGYQDPLGPQELYTLHQASTYWVDAGPRTVAVRGHALRQHYPMQIIGGVTFDLDDMAPDLLDDLPWVASAG